jgi:hypothetical protein
MIYSSIVLLTWYSYGVMEVLNYIIVFSPLTILILINILIILYQLHNYTNSLLFRV